MVEFIRDNHQDITTIVDEKYGYGIFTPGRVGKTLAVKIEDLGLTTEISRKIHEAFKGDEVLYESTDEIIYKNCGSALTRLRATIASLGFIPGVGSPRNIVTEKVFTLPVPVDTKSFLAEKETRYFRSLVEALLLRGQIDGDIYGFSVLTTLKESTPFIIARIRGSGTSRLEERLDRAFGDKEIQALYGVDNPNLYKTPIDRSVVDYAPMIRRVSKYLGMWVVPKGGVLITSVSDWTLQKPLLIKPKVATKTKLRVLGFVGEGAANPMLIECDFDLELGVVQGAPRRFKCRGPMPALLGTLETIGKDDFKLIYNLGGVAAAYLMAQSMANGGAGGDTITLSVPSINKVAEPVGSEDAAFEKMLTMEGSVFAGKVLVVDSPSELVNNYLATGQVSPRVIGPKSFVKQFLDQVSAKVEEVFEPIRTLQKVTENPAEVARKKEEMAYVKLRATQYAEAKVLIAELEKKQRIDPDILGTMTDGELHILAEAYSIVEAGLPKLAPESQKWWDEMVTLSGQAKGAERERENIEKMGESYRGLGFGDSVMGFHELTREQQEQIGVVEGDISGEWEQQYESTRKLNSFMWEALSGDDDIKDIFKTVATAVGGSIHWGEDKFGIIQDFTRYVKKQVTRFFGNKMPFPKNRGLILTTFNKVPTRTPIALPPWFTAHCEVELFDFDDANNNPLTTEVMLVLHFSYSPTPEDYPHLVGGKDVPKWARDQAQPIPIQVVCHSPLFHIFGAFYSTNDVQKFKDEVEGQFGAGKTGAHVALKMTTKNGFVQTAQGVDGYMLDDQKPQQLRNLMRGHQVITDVQELQAADMVRLLSKTESVQEALPNFIARNYPGLRVIRLCESKGEIEFAFSPTKEFLQEVRDEIPCFPAEVVNGSCTVEFTFEKAPDKGRFAIATENLIRSGAAFSCVLAGSQRAVVAIPCNVDLGSSVSAAFESRLGHVSTWFEHVLEQKAIHQLLDTTFNTDKLIYECQDVGEILEFVPIEVMVTRKLSTIRESEVPFLFKNTDVISALCEDGNYLIFRKNGDITVYHGICGGASPCKAIYEYIPKVMTCGRVTV